MAAILLQLTPDVGPVVMNTRLWLVQLSVVSGVLRLDMNLPTVVWRLVELAALPKPSGLFA
jgi:hypothetical protein